MVAPTKIIAGLGLSLGIDILEAPGATGDSRTHLTSKAKAIAKALCSNGYATLCFCAWRR
jgi:2,3-bisphosphoglycerate-independent phosphoglycerate mutase